MNTSILEIKNLQKTYGVGVGATKVLRGINLHIELGEFVIIFGPSGAGKSTLLNIINGLEIPSSGSVVIDGRDLTQLTEAERAHFHRETIGMVFQAYNLIPYLSIIDNITLPLFFAKVPVIERNKRGMQLLKEFGLESLAKRLPTEISGGQAQRVGIMRALIGNPPIIVADEPTGNLDSIASKNVMDLFAQLNKVRKNTLIVVTHDASLFRYADRIIHVLDGNVVKEVVRKKESSATDKHKVEKSVFEMSLERTKDKTKQRLLNTLQIFLSKPQLDSFEKEELERTVMYLDQRRAGRLSETELFLALDKPFEEGGAGLYRPTAKHLSESFENILELIK